jgi:hypothetical protein
MKVKTAVIWSCLHDKLHRSLSEEDGKIAAMMPLVETLFPGINYYSITGFMEVFRNCVIPALKKRHPEVLTLSEADIQPDDTTKVKEVLRSKGYEWQNSKKWRAKFERFLSST